MIVLSLLTGLLGVTPGIAAASTETTLLSLTNNSRAAAGLGSLARSADLDGVARRHSQWMADTDTLAHNNNLANDVSNWVVVAENVGLGADIGDVHNEFMKSRIHRDNILDSRVTQMGVGVVVVDGVTWVTEVFRRPSGQASPAPPPPAPAPSPTAEPVREPDPAPAVIATAAHDHEPDPEPDPEPEPELKLETVTQFTSAIARLAAIDSGRSLTSVLSELAG